MKRIVLFILLALPVFVYSQIPNINPRNIRLLYQTTGDGIIWRGSDSINYTPTTVGNAWMHLDTVNNKLYSYVQGQWQLIKAGGLTGVYMNQDTLFLTTVDTVFYTLITPDSIQYNSSLQVLSIKKGNSITLAVNKDSTLIGNNTLASPLGINNTNVPLFKDTLSSLATKANVALKLNISDTSAMLANYVNFSDTLSVSDGGTGKTKLDINRVLFGNDTLPIGTDNNLYWSNANNRLLVGTGWLRNPPGSLVTSRLTSFAADSSTVFPGQVTYNHLLNYLSTSVYDNAAALFVSGTPNTYSYVSVNSPETVLILGRMGFEGPAYGNIVRFDLSKHTLFENEPRTRMDIRLSAVDEEGDNTPIVMTLRSDYRVGINQPTPSTTLDVNGTVKVSNLVLYTPTRLVGADANGALGDIALGGGLTLVNDTLYGQDTTSLYNQLNLKLNISDTASMLTNYINVVDTASMLAPYLRLADTSAMLTNYVNIADTASMLSTYMQYVDTVSLSNRINTKQDQLNGTGFVKVNGTVISYDTSTYLKNNVDSIIFNTTYEGVAQHGEVIWNNQNGTLMLGMANNVEIPLGQGEAHLVKNVTGNVIPKGKVVYISGATGQKPQISLASASSESTSSKTFGITAEDIDNNDTGFVFVSGYVHGIKTDTFTTGQALWLSSNGNITNIPPQTPLHSVFVGYAINQKINGTVFVKIQNGYELDELHDVKITSPTERDVLMYDSTLKYWVNKAILPSVKGTYYTSTGADLTSTQTDSIINMAGSHAIYLHLQSGASSNLQLLLSYPGDDDLGKILTVYAQDDDNTWGVQIGSDIWVGVNFIPTYNMFNGQTVTLSAQKTSVGNRWVVVNDPQDLSLSGQTLAISGGGTSVTLPVVGVTAGTGINTSTTSGNVTVNLANSGVSAGTYNNSATSVTPITVDTTGRITGTGSPVTITPAWSSITSTPTTISGYGITDAYTKTEVDNFLQGLDPKASVKAATVANITLSGEQTVDNIALVTGDRVLVKNQDSAPENGIYIVSTSTWSRSSDMNSANEFAGAYVFVEQGNVNADRGYVCTSDVVSVGVSAVNFVQFTGSGAYQPVLTGTGYVYTNNGTVTYVSGTASEFVKANGTLDNTAYYPLSNPAGYTSNVGTITGVTAGTGLSGGGTSGTVTLNLANTTVTPSTYGDAATVPVFTVDAQGRITNATNTNISIPLARITQTGASTGQVIKWSGSTWAPSTDLTVYNSDGTLTANRILDLSTYDFTFRKSANEYVRIGDRYIKITDVTAGYETTVDRTGIQNTTTTGSLDSRIDMISGIILLRAENAITAGGSTSDIKINTDGKITFRVDATGPITNIYGKNSSGELTSTAASTVGLNLLSASSTAAVRNDLDVTPKCGAIINGKWREFMCYNLGSVNMNADPFTPSWEIIGDYWQWGKKVQQAFSPTGSGAGEANDGVVSWTTVIFEVNQYNNAAKTANDPCPEGYRVPTDDEWQSLITQYSGGTPVGDWTNSATNYTSGRKFGDNLFLPAAGARNSSNGSLFNRGSNGYYWTSASTSTSNAKYLLFNSTTASVNTFNKTHGVSVRCISEIPANVGSEVVGTGYANLAPPVNGMIVEGNVGIGNNDPTSRLHVSGNTTLDGTIGLRASSTTSAATQIPVFTQDPTSITRTLSTRTPAQLLSDIGAGTVSSVGLSLPTNIFTVSNSPVTTSGTLTGALANQNANLVFAGPTSGLAAAPTFRSLVSADIPLIDLATKVSGQLPVANGGTGQATLAAAGIVTGTATAGQVAFWNAANTQAGDANLIWDNILKRFRIGPVAPLSSNYAGVGDFSVTKNGVLPISLTAYSNDPTSAPTILYQRARGTGAAPATINAGDYIGSFSFEGYHRTTGQRSSSFIGVFAEQNFTENSFPSSIFFSTGGTATLSERLRITSAGSVNIGGDYGQTADRFKVTGTAVFTDLVTSGRGFLINSGQYSSIATIPYAGMFLSDAYFNPNEDGFGSLFITSRSDAARPIVFGTSTGSVLTERMRIAGNGNVGIGTATPTERLTVNGNILVSGTNPLLTTTYPNYLWVTPILTAMAGESFSDAGMIGILYDRNELTNAGYRGDITISGSALQSVSNNKAETNVLVDSRGTFSGNMVLKSSVLSTDNVIINITLPSFVGNYSSARWQPFLQMRLSTLSGYSYPRAIKVEVSSDNVNWYTNSTWQTTNFVSSTGFWIGEFGVPNTPSPALTDWRYARFILSDFSIGVISNLWISEIGIRHLSAPPARQYLNQVGTNTQYGSNFIYGLSETEGTPLSIFNSNLTSLLHVSNIGRVGIGTNDPQAMLDIRRSTNANEGSAFPRINIQNTSTVQGTGSGPTPNNFADISISSGNTAVNMLIGTSFGTGNFFPQGSINVTTSHPLLFKTTNTERMRITSGGNVGIGTTTPNTILDVYSNADIWHFMIGGATSKLLIAGQGVLGTVLQGAPGNHPNNTVVTTPYNIVFQRDGGNVGIGNVAPQNRLHVHTASAATSYAQFTNTVTGASTSTAGLLVGVSSSGNGFVGINSSDGFISFSTGTSSVERMRFTSSTDIIIGSGEGTGLTGLGKLRGTNGAGTNAAGGDFYIEGGRSTGSSSGGSIYFQTSPSGSAGTTPNTITERMVIQGSGNIKLNSVVYGNTTNANTRTLYIGDNYIIGGVSSIRASKKNITDIDSVDYLYQLQPVTFNYRKKDSNGNYTEEIYEERVHGLIAEDVSPVADFLVNYDVNQDGTKKMIGIEYPRLIVPLLKAVQDQKSEIDELKTKLQAQNDVINLLIKRIEALEQK
jgi:uncharacterized protein (TIGR02145 family)